MTRPSYTNNDIKLIKKSAQMLVEASNLDKRQTELQTRAIDQLPNQHQLKDKIHKAAELGVCSELLAKALEDIGNTSEFQLLVSEFNKAIGEPYIDNIENFSSHETDLSKLRKLRAVLIEEEALEVLQAIERKDPIELIDGLCDLLYVTYGTADIFGVALNTEIAELVSNTSVFCPDLTNAWRYLSSTCRLLMHRYEVTVHTILTSDDTAIMKSHLEDLALICWECSLALGIKLKPFFLEVHRTNMNKLTGPKREDGKQLKPKGWEPPRIKEMYDTLIADHT